MALVYNVRRSFAGQIYLKYHKHHAVTVLMAVFAVLACLALYGVSKGLEFKVYDMRVRLTEKLGLGRDQPSGMVIVVGIDDSSVTGEKPLLFVYDDIGRFIRRMDEYGAGAIGLDIILVHKQSDKLRSAAATLLEGDARKGREYGEILGRVGELLDRSVLVPIMDVSERIPIVQVIHGDLVPFYYGVSPFIQNMTLADASLTDGELGRNDGIIRKQGLRDGEYNTFASALYRLATGREYAGNEVFINYSLTGGIPFYRFDDVVRGGIDRSAFKGKTVILGYVSGYEDIHMTPIRRDVLPGYTQGKGALGLRSTGGRMPGPMVHGVIMETMLTNTSLREAMVGWNIVILIVLAGLSLVATLALRPLFAVLAVCALIAAFFSVNLFLFAGGLYLHFFPQAAAPLAVLMFVYPYRYFAEERTRRKIQKAFGYYVDGSILERLMEEEGGALMHGETKKICILFLDIRDFTALSSKHRADEVVRFLNIFFGSVTETIQRHSGFVNKFIGDGILAFFMSGENPTADAIEAAMDILKETERLNEEGRFKECIGDWDLRIGIGINHGEVILGNVGSERKMDFTIIGEHVNMASRIESLTKTVETGLLISAAARDAAGRELFPFRFIGEFVVKGVERPVPLYTVDAA